MTDRELLKQALEALEQAQRYGAGEWRTLTNALNERLAQPEPWEQFYPDMGNPFQPQRTHWEGCEEVHPECKTRRTTREEKILRPGVYEVPVEQEPVAWLYRDSWGTMKLSQVMPPPVGAFPVYTTSPRREWVGLTDEEWAALWEEFAWESEFTSDEQFQEEMVKKHGKGHYYMDTDEAWNRQKDLIQKLVTDKLREKNT